MNTNDTTPTLDGGDILEVLNGIFDDGMDLSHVMQVGLAQLKADQAEAEAALKAGNKAAKKAAWDNLNLENAEINVHLAKSGLHAAVGGLCLYAIAATPGLNIGLAVLALTQGARVNREVKLAKGAKVVRNLRRDGIEIEVSTEEQVRDLIGEHRFEAMLACVDAGALLFMGINPLNGFLVALAALDLLAAGMNALTAEVGVAIIEQHNAEVEGRPFPPTHRKPRLAERVAMAHVVEFGPEAPTSAVQGAL